MLQTLAYDLLLKLCKQHEIECLHRTINRNYIHDSSCIGMHPKMVVRISHPSQLPLVVKFAREHDLLLSVKGGGSNTGGAGMTHGVLVDVSKLNAMSPPVPLSEIEGDVYPPPNATHVVVVGAGATIYDLNRYLAQYSLLLPVVPTSHRLAQIGGAIATNAGSPESLRFGTIQQWIATVDFCDGTAQTHSYIDDMLCGNRASAANSTLSETIDSVTAIMHSGSTIGLKGKISRYLHYKQVPGYNLPALFSALRLPKATVLNALLAGSMGTLGIVSRALLYCIPKPTLQYIMILEFNALLIALKMLPKIRAIVKRFQQIVSCELLPISQLTERAQLMLAIRCNVNKTEVHTIRDAIWRAMSSIVNIGCFSSASPIGARFVQRRKTAVLSSGNEQPQALSIINDITIPIRRLSHALPVLMAFLVEKKVRFKVYGHILQGNLHFRPRIDFSTISEKYVALQLSRKFYQLVMSLGGIIGGEHGTGILRAPYVRQLWGKAGYTMMRQLLNHFNPQRIFDSSPIFNTIFADHLPASLYDMPRIDID